jgi:hypothetical protein
MQGGEERERGGREREGREREREKERGFNNSNATPTY